MKRYSGWTVLCVGVVVLAGVAFAGSSAMRQRGEPRRPMRRGMGMMPGGLAAYGGDIYLVRDGELQKLDRNLETVASAVLPETERESGQPGAQGMGPGMMGPGMMMGGGPMRDYGPGPGMLLMMAGPLNLSDEQVQKLEEIAQRAHEDAQDVLTEGQREKLNEISPMRPGGQEQETPSGMMGPGMGRGMRGGMMGGGMGRGMRGGMMGGGMMQRGRRTMPGMEAMMRGQGMPMMGHMAEVAADEGGVYLLIGGRLIVYDHDLNEQRSVDLRR